MKKKVKIHPLNAKGKYYVDQNVCLVCEDCVYVAPDNFKYDNEDNYGYFVAKQPQSVEEEEKVREAVNDCPLEAILDDGNFNNQ